MWCSSFTKMVQLLFVLCLVYPAFFFTNLARLSFLQGQQASKPELQPHHGMLWLHNSSALEPKPVWLVTDLSRNLVTWGALDSASPDEVEVKFEDNEEDTFGHGAPTAARPTSGAGSAPPAPTGSDSVDGVVSLSTLRRVYPLAPTAAVDSGSAASSHGLVPFRFVLEGGGGERPSSPPFRVVLQAPCAADLGSWLHLLRQHMAAVAPPLLSRHAALFRAVSDDDDVALARVLGLVSVSSASSSAAATAAAAAGRSEADVDSDGEDEFLLPAERTSEVKDALACRDASGDTVLLSACRLPASRVLALLLWIVLPALDRATAGRVVQDITLEGDNALHLLCQHSSTCVLTCDRLGFSW